MNILKTTILDTPMLVNPGDRMIIMRYENYRAMEEIIYNGHALADRVQELLVFLEEQSPENWDGSEYHWTTPQYDCLQQALETFVNTVKSQETL